MGGTRALMLSEHERAVLETLKREGGKLEASELAKKANLPLPTVMAALELLKSKGAVRDEVSIVKKFYLTEAGRENLIEGFPEERLLRLLVESGGRLDAPAASRVLGSKASVAIGELKRRGALAIERGVLLLTKNIEQELQREKTALREIHERGSTADSQALASLLRRGLIAEKIEREVRVVYVPAVADRLLAETALYVAKLSSDDIATGRWRELTLKEYNVEAEPPETHPGLEHFFDLFIEKVRSVLRDMGFTEFDYSFIVQEFWNFDMLFQAQDHPSREIHDTFWISYSTDGILDAEPELVERVKRVHERGSSGGVRGWGGEWSIEVAKRFVLRTQMTSATIRALSNRPKPPFRIYSIGRVFRPDQIDYKRLPEFTQLDGIVSHSGFTFRDLLSILKDFFSRLGFEKVKFKPAYFPFTEPSVEGYVYFEGRGWVEVFGAGLFRPEILEVLGYSDNVGAWGMGLERLAMKLLGVNDIREFYSKDVSKLRELHTRALRVLGEL